MIPAEEIRAARKQAGLSNREAAQLVHVNERTWRRWEAGARQMPANAWELFRIKLKQIRQQDDDSNI